MSKQIINAYMAGQIGDKYYESVGGKLEYIGVVDDIDEKDNDQRYRIESNGNGRFWTCSSDFDHFEREVPDEASDSDEGMERITDIKQVRSGDTEVTKSGNQYKVIKANYLEGSLTLRVAIPESLDGEMWLHDSAFAYALRPKPEVPTEPGLYFDKDKCVWELTGNGTHNLLRNKYGDFINRSYYLGFNHDLAPYTHIDLERES